MTSVTLLFAAFLLKPRVFVWSDDDAIGGGDINTDDDSTAGEMVNDDDGDGPTRAPG